MIVGVTGARGSAGSYLTEHIANNHPEHQLVAFARHHGIPNRFDAELEIEEVEVELTDASSVLRAWSQADVDVLFHLASIPDVRFSFRAPLGIIQNNVMSTAVLFEALLAYEFPTTVLASSAEVYGDPVSDKPLVETDPIAPVSPYAATKAMQDHLAYVYFKAHYAPIIRLRSFGYWNPRQPYIFSSSFARQIAEIEQGKRDSLEHGNLNSFRTFVDVEDVCRAYVLAAELCQPGEAYNVGGTEVVGVGDVLDMLIARAQVPIHKVETATLRRPTDIKTSVPCVDKFQARTDWEPTVTLDESLDRILAYWRQKVASQ